MELVQDTKMKKLAILFLFFLPTLFAQVPVTITFNLPSVAYLKDVELSRFTQLSLVNNIGLLTAPLTNNATSMSVSGTCPANSTAVYIDAEPMLVTAGSGTQTCTITRNSALAQAGTTAAAHNSGASVLQLKYATAQQYFIQSGVAAFIAQCISNLGSGSAVIGTNTQAITAAQAAIAATLANTAQ
jgi:hypothetical protein